MTCFSSILGIVRNIDPVRRVLYVLTPLSIDDLQQVNTLLKGNLEIPAALLLSVSKIDSSSWYSWFFNHVTKRPCWCQYNIIFLKFSSQRRETLLYLATNMAAVTSRAN